MKSITSRDNPIIKRIAALIKSNAAAREEGVCMLEGEHLAESYVNKVGELDVLVLREAAAMPAPVLALAGRALQTIVVPAKIFDSLSNLVSPSGVLAIAPIPHKKQTPATTGFVLALDDVQDPGNVGTLIRTAAAAGVQQVWCSPATAGAWSSKTLRAAQGAHFHTQVLEGVNLFDALKEFDGARWATLPHNEQGGITVFNVFKAKFEAANVLVLSHEGQGLSSHLRPAISGGLNIPMKGGVESLNVASAGAITLFAMANG